MDQLFIPEPILNTNQLLPWSATVERLKFQKRTCTTFIPKTTDRDCCVCNYDHPRNNGIPPKEIWNWNKHTKQEATHCYGILPPSDSPYVRCDIKTDLEKLCYVLLGAWDATVPDLIMRMVGDVDSTPNIKTEKELLKGIADAALASGAWMITSGYKEESISELVGEVIYDCRMKSPDINLRAIAVGKWGNIHTCHALERRHLDKQPLLYEGHGRYKLESNHTHYIFFDDGTCDSLDTGEFASNLARQLSCGAKRKIPLITVLAGGTLHSLPSICIDLKNKIPVVVINECGSLGDTLFKYMKLTENSYQLSNRENHTTAEYEEEDSSDDENNLNLTMIDEEFSHNDDGRDASSLRSVLQPLDKNRAGFVADVRKLYDAMRQEQYDNQGDRLPAGAVLNFNEEKAFGKCLYQMASCLQDPFRKNIHLFNVSLSKSLKETIYSAFVQAKDNLSQPKQKYYKTIDEQVHQAFRWGIDDFTENQPVATAKIWNDTTKIQQNRSHLINALSKNLLVFVMNFLKLDINFMTLFGPNRTQNPETVTHWSPKYQYLQELYSDEKRKNYDPLYLLDQISTNLTFTEEKHLSIVLEKLVGDFMHPFYVDQSRPKLMSTKTGEENTNDENTDSEYIFRDLFLWCVLTYRLDMAELFLSQMRTRICSALIASKILKSLATYAPDQAAREALTLKASTFETHAIEFVRCAYASNKHQTCELIMRRIDLYGGVTCLQMAMAADNKRFLYEDACQALLTNIWYDKLDSVRERNRLVANMLTMGISQIFLSIYDKFDSTRSHKKQKSHAIRSVYPERKLKKNGINYTDDYGTEQSIAQNFLHFHNRPVVKYYYSCIGYVFFLIFFSYFMLSAFSPPAKTFPSIHWTEILTIIIVTTMLFEEFRQFHYQDDRTFIGKFRSYFNLTNKISNPFLVVPSFLLFYIGLILRFTQTDPESFASARIVMALDLELWYIRLITFMSVSSQLGPKIVMIRKMTHDLSFFLLIIVVFMFGYGITSRSLMANGNITLSGRQFVYDIIYPVYYFVHGSFDSERSSLEAKPEANTFVVTKLMFVIHMMFVNVLLINLLIALFSFTINDIQTQAHYVWAYDRCEIVQIYYERPALFPPFTLLISMVRCGRWCWRKIGKNRCVKGKIRGEDSSHFQMIPDDRYIDSSWSEFERYSTNSYIRQLLDNRAAALVSGMNTDITSESSTHNSDELKRLKSLITDFKMEVEEFRSEDNEKLESMESAIQQIQTRLEQMETRTNQWSKNTEGVNTSLDWIMNAMIEGKLTEKALPSSSHQAEKSSHSSKRTHDSQTRRSNQQRTKDETTSQRSRSPTNDVRIDLDQKST